MPKIDLDYQHYLIFQKDFAFHLKVASEGTVFISWLN